MSNARLWWRYIAICCISFLVQVAPLIFVLVLNRARYFTTVSDVVKISVGGGICLLLLVLLILGGLKTPRGVTVLTFVFFMSWLLESVLCDLMLLSGCALVGKTVDWIFLAPRIRRLREKIKMHEQADVTADATAKAMEGVLQKYIGRV